jgi:precorrin-2 dehydrogenase/sirohydrochlorin ferrochelatase
LQPHPVCGENRDGPNKIDLRARRLAMIAVALDPSATPMAVAGRGSAALHRHRALRSAGATEAPLFCDRPDSLPPGPDLSPSLRCYLPSGTELAGLRALWITGLPDDLTAELAALAHAARVLVNVEDRPGLCDFHSVAEVRRGDLLLTVSTGGASPGLAARIRARLATDYGPEWAERLELLRGFRTKWRRDRQDVTALTDALLQANGWLA